MVFLFGYPAWAFPVLGTANTHAIFFQSVALEAIVQTASKRERCTFLANQGLPVLKKLYHSKDSNVQARALVVSCVASRSHGALQACFSL